MTKPTLLLVDDERSAREGLERLCVESMRYCVPPLERRALALLQTEIGRYAHQ